MFRISPEYSLHYLVKRKVLVFIVHGHIECHQCVTLNTKWKVGLRVCNKLQKHTK